MGVEAEFSNAFASEGLIPPPYGHRTILEYRAQLHAVHSQHPLDQSARHTDQVSAERNDPALLREFGVAPRSEDGLLRIPKTTEAETVLQALVSLVEAEGVGRLDPRYVVVFKVDRPMCIGGRVRTAVTVDRRKGGWGQGLRSWWRGGNVSHREVEPALISWHWGDDLLAIATGPHMDRVCAFNFTSGLWETRGDRLAALEGMTCMSFRPFAGRVLAIGCERGVALMRGGALSFLNQEKSHGDVVSLDWSADGSKMVTASREDGSVRIWDVGTGRWMLVDSGNLVRFGRGLGAKYLFVANAEGNYFRLWCTESWKNERWGYLSGAVSAVTWAPDGMTVLFATEGEGAIHVLYIGGANADDDTRIVHTELTGLPREGPGGMPVILEMDTTGERLAVVYETPPEDVGKEGRECAVDPKRRYAVALFATQLHPYFRISPLGYISGPENSGPAVAIKFKPQPCVGNRVTVLACMWRNGDVTFTQLLFDPMRH